jgi:hypothetical protein
MDRIPRNKLRAMPIRERKNAVVIPALISI